MIDKKTESTMRAIAIIILFLVIGCTETQTVHLNTDRDELRSHMPSGAHFFMDQRYLVVDDNTFLNAAWEYTLERGRHMYEEEINDCDNAAWDMVGALSKRGYACGLLAAWKPDGTGHAIVGYFNDSLKLKLVDPYSGEPYTELVKVRYSLWP